MSKRRLGDIAKDYGITWDEAKTLVSDNLDEEMVTGSGKLLWISPEGQSIIEDLVSMPRLLRGKVLSECPNPKYVYVACSEVMARVGVQIPPKLRGKLVGKVIYFTELRNGAESKYEWHPTPSQ